MHYIKNKNDMKILNDILEVVTQTKEKSVLMPIQFVKLRENTIKELVEYGIPDLPMMQKSSHLRENILTKNQAKELGFSIKNKHFHGIGVSMYLKIIKSLEHPVAIYQYINNKIHSTNNFIIVTSVKFKNNNYIIPMEVQKMGQYNNIEIRFNKIKTIYSKENSKYFSNLCKRNVIRKIYDNSKILSKLYVQK